ncbi:hypothetical protein BHE74_00058162 [Ensete ventricosum]|nr:hypothetical protein BHE74_00058162 [Ensete ventricosum]RZS27349.1 hypothetical protein BHM03_00060804 [Ensete ventricosum]
MNPTTIFVAVFALLFTRSLCLEADPKPISNVTVMGTVFCDACASSNFSQHSYFLEGEGNGNLKLLMPCFASLHALLLRLFGLLPGVKVRVQCVLRVNATSAGEMRVAVDRTTDRFGVYNLDILPVDGFECREGRGVDSFCQASLVESPSSLCDVPGLSSSTEHVAVRGGEGKLCLYNLNALNYRPSKKDADLCGYDGDLSPSSANSSLFFCPPFGFPWPFGPPLPFAPPPSFPWPFAPPPPSFPWPFAPPPPSFPWPLAPPPPSFPFPFPPAVPNPPAPLLPPFPPFAPFPPVFTPPSPPPPPPYLFPPFPPFTPMPPLFSPPPSPPSPPPSFPFPPFAPTPPVVTPPPPSPPSFPFPPFTPTPPVVTPPPPPPPSFPFPFPPFLPSPPIPPVVTPPPPQPPSTPFPFPPFPPFTPTPPMVMPPPLPSPTTPPSFPFPFPPFPPTTPSPGAPSPPPSR